ncbi:hypothetical protein BJ878DRAFT_138553 [Calycina marina]|uniref:Microbial-type PARG catalytic domain-containing protein n=1 Tax=Calycina marina TaxID=1763456 RepID=A0A9P7Z183_9HELO|nr:hypothetical protein BJ878DRAFT_138553 [Calycina marina]
MPPAKAKPSEIAADCKKRWLPYFRALEAEKSDGLCHKLTSLICLTDDPYFINVLPPKPPRHTRFAFYEQDAVDVALEWANRTIRVGVILPANDKRPGGDWEAGVMSPEECLCRRSTLYANLTTPGDGNVMGDTNYPIPERAGILSWTVAVFRGGPEKYDEWGNYQTLPVISVPPVRRPKLDPSGTRYSFNQEKELMREKITTALRIAAYYQLPDLVISTFGLGPGFRNPPEEVAMMWRDAFLGEGSEFFGHFRDVVFAFENPEGPSRSKTSSSKASSSKSNSGSSKTAAAPWSAAFDLEVFQNVFNPSNIHGSD